MHQKIIKIKDLNLWTLPFNALFERKHEIKIIAKNKNKNRRQKNLFTFYFFATSQYLKHWEGIDSAIYRVYDLFSYKQFNKIRFLPFMIIFDQGFKFGPIFAIDEKYLYNPA